MIMVTELVIKLLDSVNFYWFSNHLLSNVLFFKYSDVYSYVMEKKENLNISALCKCIGHCIMRFMLSHEAAVWRRDHGLSLWQGI